MKIAPLPDNETLRVMALERLGLLDTPPDDVFDNLVQTAANLCDVPIALICLIDTKRQWFKSSIGLDAPEASRDLAFCSHTILNPNSMMEIEDATLDERFRDNPFVVGDPQIRFYAGQPLVTSDGFAVGTLSVVDHKPRKLSPMQRAALANLAAAITNIFEERRKSPLRAISKVIEATIDTGIVITDATKPDFPISYCNQEFERITGYSKEEVLGRNSRFLQGEGTERADVKCLRDALSAQRETTVTLLNYRKDGTPFWNQMTISPIRGIDGTVTHFMGIQRDVSEQRTAEDRITGLDAVVDASVNEIYMIDDASLRFVYVNQRAIDNLGYTMEELRELAPDDIGIGAKSETMARLLKPFRDGRKQTFEFETVHTRKDGSTYPAGIQLQRSQFGSKPVIVAIALDLTRRKRVEEELMQSQLLLKTDAALRESEERYRDLFENAHDLVQSVMPDGSFAFVNPAWKNTLGFTDDDIKSLTILDIIHPDDRAHFQNLFEQFLKRENVGEIRMRFIAKNHKTVFVKGSAISNFDDGKPQSIRAIFHNVTDHVVSEKALEQARDVAEHATAIKSRFLAAASHDLRQPLQSIDLNLTALDELLTQPDAKELSDNIRSSLDSVDEILNTLLDISQLDSGAVVPNRKHFPIEVVLHRAVSNNQAAALKKRLKLRYEGEPHMVYSDPKLLVRVLENFVANAIQYSNQGEIVIRSVRCGDIASIEVHDTGIGMPEGTLNAVFDEYYQLGNPNRDRRKGLGLGLTVVKQIAALLGHEVRVKSAIGSGSTFSVEVPIGQPAEASADQVSAETPSNIEATRQPIVLFVDDYPEIVTSAMRLFKLWGVEAHAAKNEEEAIAHIEHGVRPDLIISDYRLAGTNGIELIEKIREMTSADLPAVLMTGDGSSAEIDAANASLNGVLHKPVRSSTLRSVIDNLPLS